VTCNRGKGTGREQARWQEKLARGDHNESYVGIVRADWKERHEIDRQPKGIIMSDKWTLFVGSVNQIFKEGTTTEREGYPGYTERTCRIRTK
jgi:hypothetical protein